MFLAKKLARIHATEKIRSIGMGVLFVALLLSSCVGSPATLSTQVETPIIPATLTPKVQTRATIHSFTPIPTSAAEPTFPFLIGYVLFDAEELDYDSAIYKWGRANDIWVIQEGISTPQRWIKDNLFKSQPFASPDGSQVAYVVSQITDGLAEESIWIANADGTNSRQTSPFYSIKSPEVLQEAGSMREFLKLVYVNLCGWSADGQQLAYIVGGTWPENPFLLFVINVFNGQIMRIEGNDVHSATWSPQDPNLLVTMSNDGASFLINIKTGQRTQIDQLAEKTVIFVAWMPDGQRLFAAITDDIPKPLENPRIMILDQDLQLDREIDMQEVAWTAWWSSDGNRIAYVSNLFVDEGIQSDSLLVINGDGSNRRVLVDQNLLDVYAMPLVWSLDNEWIVGFGHSTVNVGLADLYLVNVETGQITIWATNVPAPTSGRMVWCYEARCVNGGYLDF